MENIFILCVDSLDKWKKNNWIKNYMVTEPGFFNVYFVTKRIK